MASKRINFTKHAIQNLPTPQSKRADYSDEKIKGLILNVRSSGTKSFYLYKKIKGYPERIFLGTFPDLTIENARKMAISKLAEIANGVNPQDRIREIKKEYTFEEMFQEYMERYSKKHKRSWMYDEREIPKFLGHWFKRKISDIKKTEVKLLIEKIHDDNGMYQANRILERIRGMYNKTIEWGWNGSNPAAGIKKYREKPRERFVLPNEMPCLIKAFEEETNITAKHYFWILLLVGVRRTDTQKMRWTDIIWDLNIWRISVTKNGDPLNVPLAEQAMDILRNRKKYAKSDWVFPSQDDDAKHFVNFKRAWKRTKQKATIYLWNYDQQYAQFIQDEDLSLNTYDDVDNAYKRILADAEQANIALPTGLMDLRIHDLRRTFGSYQAITGSSLPIIGKSLGHRSLQSTQIYARLYLDPVRSSIEKGISVMLK
ncbi:tyrosine-type recombinase/integrase [Flavobacterium lindanitolerans]|uniref:tyrosine-type recombinase/integrase n=1 Tax=Flavobacterium lindanitolerans TaxID=428988 RepID=UPI0031B232DC